MSRRVAQCGTNSGYVRHGQKGEPHCQACRDAHNAYERARKANGQPAATRTRTAVPVEAETITRAELAERYPRTWEQLFGKRKRVTR